MKDATATTRGPRSAARTSARAIALAVHRYVGLAMAAFLFLAGITGSLIAFYPDLDALLNPELLRATPPADGAPMLDPFVLHDKLRAQLPEGQALDVVVLHLKHGEAVDYWVDGRDHFVDPYTGKVLGSRTFGDLTEGRKNLVTFIYRLHFSLALDDVGRWLMGVVRAACGWPTASSART